MRKAAYLKMPLRDTEGNTVHKIMLYQNSEGIDLFLYDSPDAIQCSSDRQYASLQDLYEDWDSLIDEQGWTELPDPLPGCQHDAFIPLRVKGRDMGNPQWGQFETLLNGKWVPYSRESNIVS